MDTFDAFSPQFDNPMRIKSVKTIYWNGMQSYFSGFIKFDSSTTGAIVRAIKL